MTTPLPTLGNQQTGRVAFLNPNEERTLMTLRGLYSSDEDETRRAWDALGSKNAAALMLGMVLSVEFDEEVVVKLFKDIWDCYEAGCTNPTIIVCSDMEGGGA